jgi:hypothetical protein
VDEVAVNIDERGLIGRFVDDVAVPNFLIESFRSAHRKFVRILTLLQCDWPFEGEETKDNGPFEAQGKETQRAQRPAEKRSKEQADPLPPRCFS